MAEYWAELFRNHNYLAVDCLRQKIWNNEKVDPWYAQNILIFAPMEIISANKELVNTFGNQARRALAYPS